MLLSEQKAKRAAEKAKEDARLALKNKLFDSMSKNTVEVNGKVFWADPGSEQNFAGRIRQMELDGATEVEWIQGDQVFTATLDELRQVHQEGTKKIAAMWDEYIASVKALGGNQ